MNDERDSLEVELRSLKPRPVPESVREAIRRDLDGRQPSAAWRSRDAAPARRWGLMLAAAAAAAAVLAGAGWWIEAPKFSAARKALARGETLRPAASPAAHRLLLATVLMDKCDEGSVMLANNGPARRVRCRFLDHAQWYCEERGRVYAMTAPREEVLLVPMETY